MVAARETTLQELLEGTKQYQVPLYQRTYSWTRAQFQRLWDDIVHLAELRAEHATATHFIGSLVLAPSPTNGPAGVQEFLVIDGQQRLTTLTILLAALRDHRGAQSPEHFERLNEQFLINKWKSGSQRLKLLPTQADRDDYLAIIDATPAAGGAGAVGTAYRFFRGALAEAGNLDEPIDMQAIEDAVLSGLALVSVTAQHGDNAHRIFESLNNTGLKLTQGDLLRNYLFMRLPTQAAQVYESLWLPLQNELDASELEQLFWIDLAQRDSKILLGETYAEQQKRLDRFTSEDEIRGEVVRFARLGTLYGRVLHPERESDPDVRHRLARLRAWGTGTANPLILDLLDQNDRGALDRMDLARALLLIESYLVRRVVVGRPSANLNRTFAQAVSEIKDADDVVDALHHYLSSGRKHYASDAAIRGAVGTVPFYVNGRSTHRKLVLQWLEESYGSREPVDPRTLTIEHVLPQTLTDEWRSVLETDLGDEESIEELHERLKHTLANLTLTGYNSTLSNSPFETKRELLGSSGVRMNREIAGETTWGAAQIEQRAATLAARIAEIWPAPLGAENANPLAAQWQLLERAVLEIPPGRWTSYGDLAALIGSHPVPVGQRISKNPIANGHRVLQTAGTPSPGFHWYERDRMDDPIEVLSSEGVAFVDGRASAEQRLGVEELATLLGAELDVTGPEDSDPVTAPGTGDHEGA